MATCDVAIVGAGPYGLSAAAHLRAANGLDIRVFGEPMSFWERHMPKGMLLRSPLAGSHLSDPSRSLTLQAYQQKSGNQISAPRQTAKCESSPGMKGLEQSAGRISFLSERLNSRSILTVPRSTGA